jgi:chloramphenicol-sensitive protein RarD
MTIQTASKTGLIYSASASLMFGLVPLYVQLTGLSGNDLFWNRMLFSLLLLCPVCYMADQFAGFKRIFHSRKTVLLMTAGSLIVGFQWWLFVWAPVNDKTQDLSLGYFLLPLTLALAGKLLFNERLSKVQYSAISFAAIGVLAAIWQQGSLPWVSLAVSILYPVYFIIRKHLDVGTLAALLFDHLLFLPAAFIILATDSEFLTMLSSSPIQWLLLPGLGILCCGSMICYINASRQMPVSLFGLMSYLEPALIFIVAVTILKEPFSANQWISYSFIWLATAIVCIESVKNVVGQKAPAQSRPQPLKPERQ